MRANRDAEILKILSMLRAAYPGSFKNETPAEQRSQFQLWSMLYSKVPEEEYRLFKKAILSYIAGEDTAFAPSPGMIRSRMKWIKNRESSLLPSQLWEQVKAVARCGKYEYKQAYEALPELAKKAVGGIGGIVQLRNSGSDSIEFAENRFIKKCQEVEREENMQYCLDTAEDVIRSIELEVSGAIPDRGVEAVIPG